MNTQMDHLNNARLLFPSIENISCGPVQNPIRPDPEPVRASDDELSDWELITDQPIITETNDSCRKSAKEISSCCEDEEWIHLSEFNFDKAQASFITKLREETKYTHSDLISHILPLLSCPDFSDTCPITFENGKIIADKIPFASQACKILQLLLAESYGMDLAWRVTNRYQLVKKIPLTLLDLKKSLLGISVNVLTGDLHNLFNHIRNEKTETSFLCAKQLTKEEIHSLKQAENYHSLSTAQRETLIRAFQSLPAGHHSKSMLQALFEGKSFGLPIWQFDCFEHDTEVAKRLTYIDSADSANLPLAISEHMCKNIAYLELKPGMIVPCLTEANYRLYYYVASKLQDKKDGVICSLLAPFPSAEWKYSEADPLVLHLNFRGTQWQPDRKDSYESLQRDLEYAGIGKISYQNRSDEIAAMVTSYLEASPCPWVKLVINGHSLGGTDTQRTLRLFVKLLAQANPPKGLEKIVAIDAFCHNSPAPEAGLNDLFAEDLQSLERQNRRIAVSLTLVLFATDPLQNAGGMYLGAQIKSPLLTKKIAFARSNLWRYFAAHRLKAFVGPLDPCEISFIDLSSPDNLMEKIFSRNYYWDIENASWIQMTGKRLHWYGGYALQPLKQAFSGSLYITFNVVRSIVRTVSPQRTEQAQIKGWWHTRKITLHPSNF